MNHLKQVGVAWHNHTDTYRAFPTGGYGNWVYVSYQNGRPGTLEKQAAGWAFQILPFLEHGNVHSGGSGGTDLERAIVAMSTPIPTYFSPSRRSAEVGRESYFPGCLGPDQTPISGLHSFALAQTDYAAANHEGTGILARNWQGRCDSAATRKKRLYDFADVTDGTSNTLLVAEKRVNVPALKGTTPQNGDIYGYTAGWDDSSTAPTQETVRRTTLEPLPDSYVAGGDDGQHRFGSSHTGGFNALLVDGSVRFVPFTIEAEIFERLGDRGDGEVVNLD